MSQRQDGIRRVVEVLQRAGYAMSTKDVQAQLPDLAPYKVTCFLGAAADEERLTRVSHGVYTLTRARRPLASRRRVPPPRRSAGAQDLLSPRARVDEHSVPPAIRRSRAWREYLGRLDWTREDSTWVLVAVDAGYAGWSAMASRRLNDSRRLAVLHDDEAHGGVDVAAYLGTRREARIAAQIGWSIVQVRDMLDRGWSFCVTHGWVLDTWKNGAYRQCAACHRLSRPTLRAGSSCAEADSPAVEPLPEPSH